MSHATIYHNGHIYTADAGGTWAEAILVEGGRIAEIGRKEDVQAAAPDGCEADDLEGRMVMPDIHDAHIHLLFSGLKFRYEARLTPMADGEQVVKDPHRVLPRTHAPRTAGRLDHRRRDQSVGLP